MGRKLFQNGMTVRRNHLVQILMVFSLLFFAFVDLDVSWSIRFFLVFAAMILDYLFCVGGDFVFTLSKIKIAYMIYGAVIILFFLIFDSRKDVEMISYIAILLLCMVCVLFSCTDVNGIYLVIRLFLAFGVLLAAYILFVEAFPNFYLHRIVPSLPNSIRDYVIEIRNTGYGVAVGGSIVYADYVMTLGFLSLLVSFLFRRSSRMLRTKCRRFIAVLIMMLFVLAIFIEGRRGEMICLVGTTVIVFFLSFRKRRYRENRKKRRLFVLIVLIVILAVTFLFIHGNESRFFDTFRLILDSLTSGGKRDITTGRIIRWNRAIELFRTSPIFGIGWGRYANYYKQGQFISDVVSIKINYKYAHNDILNVLCEMGVVGLILTATPLIFIFISAIRQNRRLIRRREELPSNILMMNLLSLGIQIFWALLGLIDPVFYKQFFLCYYAFAVVIQDSALRMESNYLNIATDTERNEPDTAGLKEELIHGPDS